MDVFFLKGYVPQFLAISPMTCATIIQEIHVIHSIFGPDGRRVSNGQTDQKSPTWLFEWGKWWFTMMVFLGTHFQTNDTNANEFKTQPPYCEDKQCSPYPWCSYLLLCQSWEVRRCSHPFVSSCVSSSALSLSIRTSWMVFGTGSIRWWIWSESWPSRGPVFWAHCELHATEPPIFQYSLEPIEDPLRKGLYHLQHPPLKPLFVQGHQIYLQQASQSIHILGNNKNNMQRYL